MDFSKKNGIIIGVANEKSICWEISRNLINNGAKLVIGYTKQTESRVKALIEGTNALSCQCDVSNDESITFFFDFVKKEIGKIDFLVCAPAFTKKQNLIGDYCKITREDFLETMNISVYSLTAICNIFQPIMNDNCSILTLSYYGSTKIVPNYNVMGVAKSALEASVRYLANDLGGRGIRVNSISAGPIKTLASSAISDFRLILEYNKKASPLKRNTTQQDISNTALFLLSDLSAGITAENIYVDCGLNNVAFYLENKNK